MDHVMIGASETDSRALIQEYAECKVAIRDFWREVEELRESIRTQAISVIWESVKINSAPQQAKCLNEIDSITTQPDIVFNLLEVKKMFIQDHKVI